MSALQTLGSMGRGHQAKTTGTRPPASGSGATLTLLPAVPTRFLVVEGVGHPDCTDFQGAVEAIDEVAQILRRAMERAGRIGESIGAVERTWTFHQEDWHWKVRVQVPHSITATAVEVAKHFAFRSRHVAPICLTAAAA